MATAGSQHVRHLGRHLGSHLGRHLGYFKIYIFSKVAVNFLEISRNYTVFSTSRRNIVNIS